MTDQPFQPNHLFNLVKARPSHAFTFQNVACAATRARNGFINSDENGRLFLGPGDNPRAWVNVILDRNNNSIEAVDGIPALVRLPSGEKQTLDTKSDLSKPRDTVVLNYVEMLSYV